MFKFVTLVTCISLNTVAGFIRNKEGHIVNPIDILSSSHPEYVKARGMLRKEYTVYQKDGAVCPFQTKIFGTGMSKEMFYTFELPYFFTHENRLIPREVSQNIIRYNADIFDFFYVAKWNAFASCLEKNPKIFSDPSLYILPIPNDLDSEIESDSNNQQNSPTPNSDSITISDKLESNRELDLYLSNTPYTQDIIDMLIKITKHLSVFAFRDFYVGNYSNQLKLQFNSKKLNFLTLEIDHAPYSFPNFLSFSASYISTNEFLLNISNTNILMHDAFITFDQSTDIFSIFASTLKCIVKKNIFVMQPHTSAVVRIGYKNINDIKLAYINEELKEGDMYKMITIQNKRHIHEAFSNIYKRNGCVYHYRDL